MSSVKTNFQLSDFTKCKLFSYILTYGLTVLLLSRFSCVQLCATPQTAAHQASPSLGFSRQELCQESILTFHILNFTNITDSKRFKNLIILFQVIMNFYYILYLFYTHDLENCKVRELEKARFRKRMRPALYRNRSPLMRREGAAVRLGSRCPNPRKE